MLGLLAVGALAGCAGSAPRDTGRDPEGDTGAGSLPGGSGDDTDGTSLAGSCASAFGDTLQRYDVGERDLIATFGYPMGGEILDEQDDAVAHGTVIGYGRGEISPLHSVTVFEQGPTGEPVDATQAWDLDAYDDFEAGTLRTWDGQERPAVIRRRADSAVTYIFHAEGPGGVYLFDVTTAAGEADGCPEVYESVTRRVAESFEPLV